nr:hypothetical protein [Pseudanabaena sp. FACHB-1998]
MQQFASLMEIMEILSDREFMSDLREGIRQADLGQTVSLEVMKLEFNFQYCDGRLFKNMVIIWEGKKLMQ